MTSYFNFCGQAYEEDKPPAVGGTVCVFKQNHRKKEEEFLYYDGMVSRVCADGRYEVSPL